MSTVVAIAVTVLLSAGFAWLGIARSRGRRLGLEEYTTSRSSVGGMAATATIAASALGAWVLFSPAETATWAGITGLIGYGLGQAAPLAALALLGPRMRALMPRGHGLSEYTWHRYGRLTSSLTVVFMLFYLLVFLAAELTAVALVLREMAGVPLWLSALLVAGPTLLYTVYGGLRASMLTDVIQFVLIVPLVLVLSVFTPRALGGFGAAMDKVAEQAPHLLAWDHRAGLTFGLTLIIAILAANLFHQGFWQRVYACRDTRSVRGGYAAGALIAIPVVLLAGLFGLYAVARDVPAGRASVALFHVATQVLPGWAQLALLVLALALVMSSLDTLLNAIASTVTTDLLRLRPGTPAGRALVWSRTATALAMVPAVLVAMRGVSVLYLFLIADLVCSAAVFPVFFGLYARRLGDRGAATSIVAGLAVGVLFFPKPDLTPWFQPDWLPLHHDFQFLASFGGALAVSTLVAIAWNLVSRAEGFDFGRLRGEAQEPDLSPLGR